MSEVDYPGFITNALREVQASRAAAAQLKQAESAALAELERTPAYSAWQHARDAHREAVSILELQEQGVRSLAIEAYERSGERVQVPGITLKLFTTVRYSAERALAWAVEHMPALLTLDAKRFEKAALAGVLPPDAPVEIAHEPRVSIAADLDAVMKVIP